jgi:hypothetical protein
VNDVYLDPSRVGIEWLLNPASARLGELARDVEGRTPASLCDADALARDSEPLAELLRVRHYGVATGLVDPPDDIVSAWRRRLAQRPGTWGGAVTELQFDLRQALGDEHVRVFGAPRWRDGRAEDDEPGPAVEERVVDDVLVLRVRRLLGLPGDERLLAEWRAAAARHFEHRRIVLDLRGNPGGNDGHTFAWAQRRFRHVPWHMRESRWTVGGASLGLWNGAAWREARDGKGSAPPHLLAERHTPAPDDRIELVEEDWVIDAGDESWDGRMIVLVDRRTRSSGESSAWFLRDGLGAVLAGEPTTGMVSYGNIVPYVFPGSGLTINLPTKHHDYGFPVESVGFPVDVPVDPLLSVDEVARFFDDIV